MANKNYLLLTLPEGLNAFMANGTTRCGCGKSKNTASALPVTSSLNPF